MPSNADLTKRPRPERRIKASPNVTQEPTKGLAMTTIIDHVEAAAAVATERMKSFTGEAQAQAESAVEKGTKAFAEASDFAKGNVEALVASGRAAAKGAEALAQDAAEFGRKSLESATTAFRGLSTAKSPTELFKLQSEFAKSSFDASVAQASKTSEALIKIMGEMFEPLSSRATLAVDKARSAAL
jgi:phasin family protein